MKRAIVMLALLTGCSGEPDCRVGATRCVGSTLETCAASGSDGSAAWGKTDDCALTAQVCRDCADLGPAFAGNALCVPPTSGIVCSSGR